MASESECILGIKSCGCYSFFYCECIFLLAGVEGFFGVWEVFFVAVFFLLVKNFVRIGGVFLERIFVPESLRPGQSRPNSATSAATLTLGKAAFRYF